MANFLKMVCIPLFIEPAPKVFKSSKQAKISQSKKNITKVINKNIEK